jgi:Tfp pilus assembly protein PilF
VGSREHPRRTAGTGGSGASENGMNYYGSIWCMPRACSIVVAISPGFPAADATVQNVLNRGGDMKMKFITCMIGLLICCSVTCYASDLSRAKDFIKAGKYPQATALLEKETSKNPGNAEGWYELGNVQLLTGKYAAAEESYKSAVQLSSSYANKVGNFYRVAGDTALKQGRVEDAISLYGRYFDYQPQERKKTAEKIYAQGEKAFKDGVQGEEENYFRVASNLNTIYRPKIYALYKAKGDQANDDQCALFYGKAALYRDAFDEAPGRRVLNIAKTVATQPGRESQADAYKVVARQYLGDATVQIELPDVKVYGPGEYWFQFEPGEQLAYWVTFPERVTTNFEIFSTPGSDFVRIHADGRITSKNESTHDVNPKFKFRGVAKSTIKMVVTQN